MGQFDSINRLIQLSVIQLSGIHCIVKVLPELENVFIIALSVFRVRYVMLEPPVGTSPTLRPRTDAPTVLATPSRTFAHTKRVITTSSASVRCQFQQHFFACIFPLKVLCAAFLYLHLCEKSTFVRKTHA